MIKGYMTIMYLIINSITDTAEFLFHFHNIEISKLHFQGHQYLDTCQTNKIT